jgi:DNA polymerase III psi subunit
MDTLKASNPLALPFLMTEDLYSVENEIAVFIENNIPEASKPEPAFFEYLGENNKYLLLLVNDPQHQNINPKELETLVNILKAKKQELKDVAIVNLAKYPSATFDELKNFFACNALVLFGINPAQIKLDGVQSNQLINHQNTKVLATFSFAEMQTNTDKKRAFWDEMKKL